MMRKLVERIGFEPIVALMLRTPFEIGEKRGIRTLEEIGPVCADAIPLGFVYLFPPPR
jgi:hypothetical protein